MFIIFLNENSVDCMSINVIPKMIVFVIFIFDFFFFDIIILWAFVMKNPEDRSSIDPYSGISIAFLALDIIGGHVILVSIELMIVKFEYDIKIDENIIISVKINMIILDFISLFIFVDHFPISDVSFFNVFHHNIDRYVSMKRFIEKFFFFFY